MDIVTTQFTPWLSIIGGSLIGLASGGYFLLNGRISGISGMAGEVTNFSSNDSTLEAAIFLAGLICGGVAYRLIFHGPAPETFPFSWQIMAVGGFCVGVGTRLGSGCTSGHGICGVARFSPRSIIATGLFLGVGMATVTLLRHIVTF